MAGAGMSFIDQHRVGCCMLR